jgi:hypothetical protein
MGGAVVKTHGTGTAKAGTPDLLICLAGRFCAVELKQPGKTPTPLQMKRLRTWAAAGALAGWATTEAEFVALLEHAGDLGWSNPQLAPTAGAAA